MRFNYTDRYQMRRLGMVGTSLQPLAPETPESEKTSRSCSTDEGQASVLRMEVTLGDLGSPSAADRGKPVLTQYNLQKHHYDNFRKP